MTLSPSLLHHFPFTPFIKWKGVQLHSFPVSVYVGGVSFGPQSCALVLPSQEFALLYYIIYNLGAGCAEIIDLSLFPLTNRAAYAPFPLAQYSLAHNFTRVQSDHHLRLCSPHSRESFGFDAIHHHTFPLFLSCEALDVVSQVRRTQLLSKFKFCDKCAECLLMLRR